jgi:hypothetical protein
MTDDNDWVEALLRADRATAVRDEGFVERLLPDLPAQRRNRPAWITPLMTTTGVVLALLSMGGPEGALSAYRQIEAAGFAPLMVLLPCVVVLGSSLWAISESR